MQYVVLGAAPGIAICIFIFYRDFYNKEPARNLIFSFFLGCLAILPAIGFETAFPSLSDKVIKTFTASTSEIAIFTYLIVGFSEEFSKFLGLRLYSYTQKAFDEPFDGIVYAIMVGMGFATVENIMYVYNAQDMDLAIKRMFLSVPAHATFAVIMGYFVGKAKFNPGNSFMLMLTGLLLAIFFHGTFDFFVFLNANHQVNQVESNSLIGGGAIISFIVSLVLCRKLILSETAISKRMFKDNKPNA
ncbi:MAG: PrsW family intramembrane metalloprotease [Chitinophagales bacterium]